MPGRLDERRRRERRVVGAGIAVAAGLHALALLLLPGLPGAEQPPSPELEVDVSEIVGGKAIPLDVFFGPPIIENAAGGLSFEPPTRVLSTQRAVFLPASCLVTLQTADRVFSGSVHLEVAATGRVQAVRVARSTGAPCADDVLTHVAGDLWYRWLPDERFPPPVRLTQPMTIVKITGF